MFGSSNPFGQSSSSPFGTQTQSMFGQSNNTSANNPFAPKPFGSSTPFGAQTGSSMFGGTSTGVFGAPPQTPSPFGASSQPFGSSTPAFGAPSAPAFGAPSAPAFGAPSAPAFGTSPSPFGGTSNFGFSNPQSSPFGSTAQQSQPAFGNSTFGASSAPAFGASSAPSFGTTNTPGFGASSTSAFGSSAFGASSTPSFGATNTNAFGASPTPAFGGSGTAFGNNAFGSGGGFGASSTPAFGASSTPSLSFGSSPAFGQSTSAFGNSPIGSSQSPFGAQGAQASNQTFGSQSMFGSQQVGSRVTSYAPSTEAEPGNQPAGKLQSISVMTVYKDKSHEELRWEDYQKGDKGGQRPAGQSPGGPGFSVTSSQPGVFSQSPTFAQPSANPTNLFASPIAPNNPFAQKTPTPTTNFSSSFGQNTTSPSMFGSTSSLTTSAFGSTSSLTTSAFGSSSGFATNTFPSFGSSSTAGFSSSPPIFGSAPAQVSNPAFKAGSNFSQSSPLFGTNPSLGQTGQTSSVFGQNANPGFSQTSNVSSPLFGQGNMFSSSSSLNTSNSPFSQSTLTGLSYQPTQPAQPQGALGNFNQTQIANTTSFTSGMSYTQGNMGSVPANTAVIQQIVTNPFGTLPALPQISIAQGGNSPSIQYGIFNLPVVDRPPPVRVSSPLTSRHLLPRRVSLHARKYRPDDDGPKIPFFSDEENSSTPKADAFFIPRENPRALFIRPVEKVKSTFPKDGPTPTPLQENGKSSNGVTNGANHESKDTGEVCDTLPVKPNQKLNRAHEENHGGDMNSSNRLPTGADIESLMPKLRHAEYFTEPRIQELAAKERANPGYCRRVRDFVVGRHGYGSIKFVGETDVHKLDLEMLVQFSNREVVVYMDETTKPPVGEGLNKPAEVTLLNIKCMDKKTGRQVKEGPRLEKYKDMLKRKAEEQGAQFVSYDSENGEWKFKVEHFSSYMLGDEDDDDE